MKKAKRTALSRILEGHKELKESDIAEIVLTDARWTVSGNDWEIKILDAAGREMTDHDYISGFDEAKIVRQTVTEGGIAIWDERERKDVLIPPSRARFMAVVAKNGFFASEDSEDRDVEYCVFPLPESASGGRKTIDLRKGCPKGFRSIWTFGTPLFFLNHAFLGSDEIKEAIRSAKGLSKDKKDELLMEMSI